MSRASSDAEQPECPQSRIHQSSSGNLGGGQQAIYGDNNSQYQDNRTIGINIFPPSETTLPEDLVSPIQI